MTNQLKRISNLTLYKRKREPLRRVGFQLVCALKRLFYFEITLLIGKYSSLSICLFTRFFRPYAFIFRKVFLVFLCIKLIFLDSLLFARAQTISENNFNLVQLQSQKVSYYTASTPSEITITSLPVSFDLNDLPGIINLSSLPVSFNTALLPTLTSVSSLPVSFSLSKEADLIKISSNPVSYKSDLFSGEQLKVQSNNVSYKTFNGLPVLESVSPNLIPILQNGRSIDISIKGDNFVSDSVASIGTLKIETKYVSQKELIAAIPANYLEKENIFEIFVSNPPPSGGVSKGFNVKVVDPIPIAKINLAPDIGVAPQIVTFDATQTEDLLAKYFEENLSYAWDFGDSESTNENPNVANTSVAFHKYSKPGHYQVMLTALNAYGKTSTITKEIEIRDKNEAPIIDASYASSETDDHLEIIFDTSMSFDPEGDPITFKWEPGDGTEITESMFSYKYMTKGTFIPKVTVTDSLGSSSAKFLDPITYLGPNSPPVPRITITPSESYLKITEDGSARYIAKLSAKESFDKDGELISYEWRISEVGGQGLEVFKGEEINYEFTKAGEYEVKLSVTDDRDKTIEKTETINVLKPPPIASANCDVTSGNAPLAVHFSSDGSRDFDNLPVNVIWNFGDGSENSPELNPAHTYNVPGAYLATLTVSTPDGRIKKANTKTILVSENDGPIGLISVIEPANLGTAKEAMVKLSAIGSYDHINNQMVFYSWSWIAHQIDKDKNLIDISEVINETLAENTNEEFSYTFTVPGQFTPVLEVKTEDGRKSKVTGETITVVPGQEPVAIAKITSDVLSGVDLLTVMFDASGSYDPKTNGQIVSYFWEFGDGETSNEISPEHAYNTNGAYNAKLTIQDNRGFKSVALAQTVKVVSGEEQQAARISEILKNRTENYLIADLNSQSSPLSFTQDTEKPQDSIPPQISLSIDNSELKSGEPLSFKAHITDNIGIETVGYKLVDTNNNSIIEIIEGAPGNIDIDPFMAQIDYVRNISIPENIPDGKYKLLLFAKDKADNWVGKSDSSQVVSSAINITNSLTESVKPVIIEGEELDLMSGAALIKELDDLFNTEINDEGKNKLIQVVAGDTSSAETLTNDIFTSLRAQRSNPQSVSEIASVVSLPRNDKEKKESHLKALYTTREIQVGKPLESGVITKGTYTTIYNPAIQAVSAPQTQTNTNAISVAANTSVSQGVINEYVADSITLMITTPAAETVPEVTKNFEIKCARGTECTTNILDFGMLQDLYGASATIVAVDSYGNQLSTPKTFSIDINDLIPNQPKAKYEPIIDSITPTEKTESTGALNIKVTGSMFNPQTIVIYDGNKLKTNYIDDKTITALVPAWFTTNARKINIKVNKKLNGNIYESNVKEFTISPKTQKVLSLNTKADLTKEIKGSDEALIRTGGNVYIDNSTTVFKEAGEVILPFNISNEASLNLEITGALVDAESEPVINIELDNKPVYKLTRTLRERTWETITGNKEWNMDIGKLKSGIHTLKISLPDISGKTIFVLDSAKLLFTSTVKPVIESVDPPSVYANNPNDRLVQVTGTSLGINPQIKFKDKVLNTKSIKDKVQFTLPANLELLDSENRIELILLNTEINKSSNPFFIAIRPELNILSTTANYSFSSNGILGPGAKLDVTVNQLPGLQTEAVQIAVFNSDGALIVNPYGHGTIHNGFMLGEIKTSFALASDLEEGTYHVVTLLKNGDDISNENVKKLFDDLIQGKKENFINQLQNIPASHKSQFNIGKNIAVDLMLSGVYTTTQANFVQEGQEISVIVALKGNATDEPGLVIETSFGDGTNLTGESTKHTYSISSNERFKEVTVKSKVLKDGIIISESKPELIFVYKDLPPVAQVKLDAENYGYQGDAPFMGGFIDVSFDPNDEISNYSGALDKTNPDMNEWKVFKYKDANSNQILNTEESISGSQILSSGKTFVTGNIVNPGTYYTKLTVFDNLNKSDSTQSETVQVTLPAQMLLVHASFAEPGAPTSEFRAPKAFEYDQNAEVKIQFKSNVQIRGKEPKSIIYNWDFGDGSVIASEAKQSPNPIHIYKRPSINTDRIDYHPELTVTAIWEGNYSETWSSKAGTISIIDKPEFVALEVVPDNAIGNAPLTVNFMIGENSFVKSSTITSYAFDYGDGSVLEHGVISDQNLATAALDELKSKIFTHTYESIGQFQPTFKVQVKENNKEYTFNSPVISTNGLLVSSIEVLDPPDNFITNQPIQTFKIKSEYTNPSSDENRLTIHVQDEENNEVVTELNPDSSEQTISLSEGLNTYWFELIDTSGSVQKSLTRKIILDTSEPGIGNISINNENLTGNIIEQNLQKVELQTGNEIPQILNQEELKPLLNQADEYFINKNLSNISGTYNEIILKAFDFAGNIAEKTFVLRKGNSKTLLEKTNTNSPEIISNKISNEKTPEKIETFHTVLAGKPFNIQLNTCFNDDQTKSHDNVEAKFDISNIKLKSISFNGTLLQKTQEELNDLFTLLTQSQISGCIDLADLSTALVKPNCTDSNKTACRNTCVHLDGPVCNVPVLFTNKLNTFNTQSFNPKENLSDPKNPWKVGNYELVFEVNENPETCNLYGTCLGQDNLLNKTSQDYTFKIDIKRDPQIETKNLETQIPGTNQTLKNGVLIYNKQANVKLRLTVIDNLAFSENRKPELNLANAVWSRLVEGQIPPQISISSQNIDQSDSRKYIFELTTSLTPKSTETLKLNIPVKLPADYFNPSGIEKTTSFELKVVTNISAEIISPPDGTIVNNKTKIKSKVIKPEGLEEDLAKLVNCKKTEIFYGIKSPEKSLWKTLKTIFSGTNEDKLSSKGKPALDGGLEYENLVNFNLKNNSLFKKDFLSGSIFGPIEIAGEYSTSCNASSVSYGGNTKNYILLDNPILKKVKCEYPEDSKYSRCEITVSSNTLLDTDKALKLEVTPNAGTIDPGCTIPDITFEKENKLTKTIKINCLPKEATSFEIKLKRNPNFLSEIQNKISQNEVLMSVTLSSFDEAIIADSKSIEVKNVPQELFFTTENKEDDSVKLSFVNNGIAIIPDDIALGLMSLSLPFGEILTLLEFKQLLKDLKLLNEDNNNGFDLETQEATYELLNIIDNLRCGLSEINSNPTLRKQTINLQCGISTSDYLTYINDSIQKNLPIIVSLIALSGTLKQIGAENPPLNIELPDSLLLRAIAVPTLPGRLLPWQLQVIGTAGLVIYNALANAKLKVETRDTTCKRAFGIIDRRFIIGKDLNNLDRKRTNTMAGVQVEGLSTETKVIEPFPHLPKQPGIYYACLPDGTHNIQLQFNGQNTFSMSLTIGPNSNLNFVEPFIGGVFRKYGTKTAIPKIIDSKTIFSSIEGDIRSTLNPSGSGAYLTNLSLKPNVDATAEEIAEALRLYKYGTFEVGNPNSKGDLELERASAFIDLAIDTKKIFLDHNNTFPLQFVLPTSPISFGNSGEQSDFILIDQFNLP